MTTLAMVIGLFVLGDVTGDGNVTAADAAAIHAHLADPSTPIERGDVDGDGIVTAKDAERILQIVAGNRIPLRVAPASLGALKKEFGS